MESGKIFDGLNDAQTKCWADQRGEAGEVKIQGKETRLLGYVLFRFISTQKKCYCIIIFLSCFQLINLICKRYKAKEGETIGFIQHNVQVYKEVILQLSKNKPVGPFDLIRSSAAYHTYKALNTRPAV